MPRDLFLRSINLDLCYPPFLERLLDAKAAARKRGASYITTELHRSMDRSDALYKVFKQGGPRAAPAGTSGHNFGISSDEALILNPAEPPSKRKVTFQPADFKILYEECAKVGLTNGSSYNDWPHIEIPGWVTADQLKPLKKIWEDNPLLDTLSRLKEVWKYLDQHVKF